MVSYINNNTYGLNSVWLNMLFYIDTLTSNVYKGEYSKYLFPNNEEYGASSCSIIKYDTNKLLMNIRYVNYNIMPNGDYLIKSSDGIVKTKNAYIYLNNSLQPISDICHMKEELPIKYPTNIQGLEDVRIFYHADQLYFSATTKEIVENGALRIAIGKYNIQDNIMNDINVIEPPRSSDCEKNWIYVSVNDTMKIEKNIMSIEDIHTKINFIYEWHPFRIGAVDNNKLVIHTEYATPRFFSMIRGSSNICEYDDKLWCVVHFVRYTTPRVYHHCIVQLNKMTLQPEKYSLPFNFKQIGIEYCLGLNIKDNIARIAFSENDSTPGLITIPLTQFDFLSI
jgi:hypothetical protein